MFTIERRMVIMFWDLLNTCIFFVFVIGAAPNHIPLKYKINNRIRHVYLWERGAYELSMNLALLSNYMMVSIHRKMLLLKDFNNVQLLVDKFPIHNMSAPHKWGISELKASNSHVLLGPTECNQEVV